MAHRAAERALLSIPTDDKVIKLLGKEGRKRKKARKKNRRRRRRGGKKEVKSQFPEKKEV